MFGRRKEEPNRYTYPETTAADDTATRAPIGERNTEVHRRDDENLRPATPATMAATANRGEVHDMPRRDIDDTPVDVHDTSYTTETVVARGGLALGAVLTGTLVAFGAMVILTALVAGIFAAAGLDTGDAAGDQSVPIAIGAIFVIMQFAAYFWGGYTAGRMARGTGAMNGFLVPIVALLVAFGTGAIVRAMGAEFNLNAGWATQLNVDTDTVLQFGIGLGIASLVAMLAGGTIGGLTGQHWHDKLEVGEVRGRRTRVAA